MVRWYGLGQPRCGRGTGGVPTAVRRTSPGTLNAALAVPRSLKNRRSTAFTLWILIREEKVEAKVIKARRRAKEKALAKGKNKPMRHRRGRTICGPTTEERQTVPWGRGMNREEIDEAGREIRRGAEGTNDHRSAGRANRHSKPGQIYQSNSPRRVGSRRWLCGRCSSVRTAASGFNPSDRSMA